MAHDLETDEKLETTERTKERDIGIKKAMPKDIA